MQKVSYMGNGTTTEFAFNFPYFENSNIIVTKNGAAATGYDIIGTSAGLDADIPYTGGTVVFEVAPTALDNITIARQLPLTRIVDYQPLAKIDPTTLNQDMNYTMEVLKDLQDELDGLMTQYAEIADKESTATLLARITAIHDEIVAIDAKITALGDVSEIRNNILINTNDITALKGYDYVIESQSPTAENNYTWYRKYKSGWVEQGGRITNGTTWNGGGLLATPFTNSNYNIQATMSRNSFGNNTDAFNYFVSVEPVDTMSFCWATIGHGGTQNFRAFQWCACGY